MYIQPSTSKSPVPNPKSDEVVMLNLSPVPSSNPIPVPNLIAPVVTICALPTAVTVFFALLLGFVNNVDLPSITTVFVSTLSIVADVTNVPLASYCEMVFPALGADPVNPLYLIFVLPSPLSPATPSVISIPLSAK